MYKNLIDVAKRIVAIANTREQNQQEGFFSLSNPNLSDYDVTYDNQLTEILMNLELDEVMALQTIMYLGRDKDYNSNLTSDEIFLDYKKYIESLGIKTKELEVANRDIKNLKLYNNTLKIMYDNIRAFKHDFHNIMNGIGRIYNCQ